MTKTQKPDDKNTKPKKQKPDDKNNCVWGGKLGKLEM